MLTQARRSDAEADPRALQGRWSRSAPAPCGAAWRPWTATRTAPKLLERQFTARLGRQYDTAARARAARSGEGGPEHHRLPHREGASFSRRSRICCNGDPPLFPKYPVCTECRMRENNCLLIERGEALLRPADRGRVRRALSGPERSLRGLPRAGGRRQRRLRAGDVRGERDPRARRSPPSCGPSRPARSERHEHERSRWITWRGWKATAAITVELDGEPVTAVRFDVFEGARLLEALVRGRSYEEIAPDRSRASAPSARWPTR